MSFRSRACPSSQAGSLFAIHIKFSSFYTIDRKYRCKGVENGGQWLLKGQKGWLIILTVSLNKKPIWSSLSDSAISSRKVTGKEWMGNRKHIIINTHKIPRSALWGYKLSRSFCQMPQSRDSFMFWFLDEPAESLLLNTSLCSPYVCAERAAWDEHHFYRCHTSDKLFPCLVPINVWKLPEGRDGISLFFISLALPLDHGSKMVVE